MDQMKFVNGFFYFLHADPLRSMGRCAGARKNEPDWRYRSGYIWRAQLAWHLILDGLRESCRLGIGRSRLNEVNTQTVDLGRSRRGPIEVGGRGRGHSRGVASTANG